MYDDERILFSFGQKDAAKYHFRFTQTQWR
jgi:hypothetical protein